MSVTDHNDEIDKSGKKRYEEELRALAGEDGAFVTRINDYVDEPVADEKDQQPPRR